MDRPLDPTVDQTLDRSFAFPRSHRLVHKAEFLRLRAVSQKWVARHWILYYARNEVGLPRLAVSISARYGNSVQRNRLRRFLRESFRLHPAPLAGLDLHFIAKQKPVDLPEKRYKEELHEDFRRLLQRFA